MQLTQVTLAVLAAAFTISASVTASAAVATKIVASAETRGFATSSTQRCHITNTDYSDSPSGALGNAVSNTQTSRCVTLQNHLDYEATKAESGTW